MGWGTAISVGLGLLGNQLNNPGNDANEQISQNTQLQRDFAQKGIRWRVQDAQAAGIHPLYALGANLPTYSPNPIAVGGGSPLGDGLIQAGQDIGRAVDASRTSAQRMEARLAALSVERAELENDKLRSEISRLNIASNPPMQPDNASVRIINRGNNQKDRNFIPGYGSGDVDGLTMVVPDETISAMPGSPWATAGTGPESRYNVTATGLAPAPNQEALEDADLASPHGIGWALRNMLLPSLGITSNPPPASELPEGYDDWAYDPLRQEYYPIEKKWYHVPPIDQWF